MPEGLENNPFKKLTVEATENGEQKVVLNPAEEPVHKDWKIYEDMERSKQEAEDEKSGRIKLLNTLKGGKPSKITQNIGGQDSGNHKENEGIVADLEAKFEKREEKDRKTRISKPSKEKRNTEKDIEPVEGVASTTDEKVLPKKVEVGPKDDLSSVNSFAELLPALEVMGGEDFSIVDLKNGNMTLKGGEVAGNLKILLDNINKGTLNQTYLENFVRHASPDHGYKKALEKFFGTHDKPTKTNDDREKVEPKKGTDLPENGQAVEGKIPELDKKDVNQNSDGDGAGHQKYGKNKNKFWEDEASDQIMEKLNKESEGSQYPLTADMVGKAEASEEKPPEHPFTITQQPTDEPSAPPNPLAPPENPVASRQVEDEPASPSPKKRKTKAEKMAEYFADVTDKKDFLERLRNLPTYSTHKEKKEGVSGLSDRELGGAYAEIVGKIQHFTSPEFLGKGDEESRKAEALGFLNSLPPALYDSFSHVLNDEWRKIRSAEDLKKTKPSRKRKSPKKADNKEKPTMPPEKKEEPVPDEEKKDVKKEGVDQANQEDILSPENLSQGSREMAKISGGTRSELPYVENIEDASEFIGRHYMPFLEEIGKPLEGEKSLMSRLFGRSKFADSDVQEKNYIVRRTQEMRKMLEDLHTKFPSPSQHSRFEDQYRWVSQSLDGFLAQNGIEVVPPEETKKPTPVPVPTPDQNQNPSSDVEIIPPGETRKDVPPTPKDQSGNPIIDIMGGPEHKILKPKKKGLFAQLAAGLGAFGAIAALLSVNKDIKKDHKEIVPSPSPTNHIQSITNTPATPRPGVGVEFNTQTNKQNVASGEIKKDATTVKESVGQSFPEPDENDEFMKRFNFGREYFDDGVQKANAPIETLAKSETATNQVASVSGAVEEIKKPEVKKTSKILSFAERQAQFSERGRFFREFEINFENELNEVKNSKDAKVVIDKYYGIINREITNPAHGEIDIVYSKSPTTGRIDKRFVPYETIADKKMIATVAEKTSNTIANLGAKFGFGVSHETDFLTLTRDRFNNQAVEQEESLLALKKQAGDSALLQQQLKADYEKQQKAGVGANGGGASYKVETAPGYTNDSADNTTRTIQGNVGVSTSGPRVRVVNQPIGTGIDPVTGLPWGSTYYVPTGGTSLHVGLEGGIGFGGHSRGYKNSRIESRGGNTSANRASIRANQVNDGTGTTTINTSPVVRRSVPSSQPSPGVKEIRRAPVTKPSLVASVPQSRPSPTINAGGPPPRSNPSAGAGGPPPRPPKGR